MSSPDDKTVIGTRSSTRLPDQPGAAEGMDPERTIVVQKPAPDENRHHALPAGTRIAEFEIVGLIGEGGFGIVYLAWDTQLRRNVALKEYMPTALASRVGIAEVAVKSQRHEETFRAGMKSFINEAQLLAQFDHHSLVKVYRFWEANGTAYMVMPYYDGITLREELRKRDAPPDEAWLRALLKPLLEALAVLHRAQCFHRDIAPDNIMLLKQGGRPLLLDFGAARRVIGDMTQALTVILKPGYAPVEQYAEVPSMKQGPWTDLYALAAVVYFAIVGKTPPPSVGRLMGDACVPLATAAAGRYPDTFLQAIDHALAVRPEDRPQNVSALAAELGIPIQIDDAEQDDDATVVPDNGDAGRSRTAALNPSSQAASGGAASRGGSGDARAPMGTAATAGTVGVQGAPGTQGGAARSGGATGTVGGSSSVGPMDGQGSGKRPTFIVAAVVCVVALGALGGWFALRPSAPSTAPGGSHAVSSPPAAALAASGATPPAAAPSAAASAPPEQTATPASAPLASTGAPASADTGEPGAPPAAVIPPWSAASEFDRIATLADPSIHVFAALRSRTARIDKDYLQFRITSSLAGYAYVFMVDSGGQYLQLFPNDYDKNNAVSAGQTLSLPRAKWQMVAAAPTGPNHFLVIVSPVPRDFSAGGIQSGQVFATFPADAQREAAARRTPTYSPFAGKPNCAAGASTCPDKFGAATFTIDIVKSSG
ncbi:serine/threonine protein kinase [Paraburkholderia sp. GAS41]|jgi:serine/threonine protein kinase|uniref:protein kinase domain-containing protein n=1 Tax=Paraburkholderia sp. GAS41 TaxID=3035134 RepID=UPI003D1E3E09